MKTIVLEGGDRVGKHTEVLYLSDTISKLGHNVLIIDYPQYWFFGQIIRSVITQHSVINKDINEIKYRCALYALDRLISLIFIKNIAKDNNIDFIISDRGWASNVITVAYGVTQKFINVNDVQSLIKYFQDIDSIYIQNLEPINFFLYSENYKINQKTDLYESEDVQLLSYKLYTENFSFPKINTQHNAIWRNSKDITNQILKNIEIKKTSKLGKINILGPHIVYPLITSTIGNLDSDYKEWNKAFYDNDKLILKDVEKKLFQKIINANLINIDIDTNIQKGISKIFKEYPLTKNIIANMSSNKFSEFIYSMSL